MTFLAPFALIGSLLLIIPILAHLFKPRKMKQTPFSSLRWLKETRQRLSRRIQWHQWLLFLMRAGCMLLLVIALAKPLIGGGTSGRMTDRFIVLDVSRSMAYQMPEAPSALERAQDLGRRVVQTGRADDRTAVIVAGSSPTLAAELSADSTAGIVALQAARPGLTVGSLGAALPLVRSLMPGGDNRDVEIIYLTDNLQGRWQHQDIQRFLKDAPKPPRVKVIDFGSASANNAWIADARLLQLGPDGERWIGVEVGCVGEARARSVRLTGIAGAQDEVREVALKHGQVARVLFPLATGLDLQGKVVELRLEPADALPSDDSYWLNLDSALALHILLVEPETSGPDGRPIGVFLHAAMEALIASKGQPLDVARRNSASVTASDVSKADVILLAGVPELSNAVLDALETRVRAGAGLGLFLGPRLDASFYAQKLHRPQQPAEGLLPVIWTGEPTDGRPSMLTNVRWAHPLLAPLQDPILGDITRTRFGRYYPLAGAAGKSTVLARFSDDVPAILEHPFGAGRVLVLNTSANDEWSDLPRSKSFLPLVDRLLLHLSAGGRKRSFTVGDTVALPLPNGAPTGEWTVLTPGGKKLAPRLATARGQTLLHLDEVTEAGAFRVESADKSSLIFTVNAARGDSPLRAMDTKALEEWWAPAAVEVLSAETAAQRLEAPTPAWPLWPTLVLLAGILLVAETVYVHRLCPRADPKAAQAVPGILKPVGVKPG